MNITFISDTHSKHNQLNSHLHGGDTIIHSGDMSSMGNKHEIENFLKWFDKLNYKYKIFIAGNHDWGFQDHPEQVKELLNEYPDVIYLEDEFVIIEDVKIYGTPWQPWFMSWAFNLPRKSEILKGKWDKIPKNVDILITHTPPYGILDKVNGRGENLGCELLLNTVNDVKPKICVFGHIHSGNGYIRNDDTHFINASILNEEYIYNFKPITVEWNKESNDITFL